MFSFLDMINHYLGYFNINNRLKGRVYSVLGGLGTAYLFYISIRFIMNHFYKQGLLILLVAFILLYFLICNIFYYFTKVQPRFDISPKLAEWLHIKEHQEVETNSRFGNQVVTPTQNANGIFDQQHVLPAKVRITPQQQRNIEQIVLRLKDQGIFKEDYNGMPDRQIYELLKATAGKPIYAIGRGVVLPYFDMKLEGDRYVVYGGLNEAEVFPIGVIRQVGLQSIASASNLDVDLFLASVMLVGGPFKVNGRAGVIEQSHPYSITTQVAYKKKQN